MHNPDHSIQTKRLVLRPWQPSDFKAFAELHRDKDVMVDLGGPISTEASRAKFDRYRETYQELGYSRWCVQDQQSSFIGYVGIVHRGPEQPLGEHDEIGWRLKKQFWGQGFAVEAAKASLADAFKRLKLRNILCYTIPSNTKSQSVIKRLSLSRAAELDSYWVNDDGSKEPIMVWRVPNP